MKFVQKQQPFAIRNSAQIILNTGLLFIAGALFIYGNQYLFLKNAHKAIGQVIDFEIPKGKVLKRPIIAYNTPDQQEHIYYHNEGTNPPKYRKGEIVTIYYNPKDYADVSLGYRFIPILILLFFGATFTVIGAAMQK